MILRINGIPTIDFEAPPLNSPLDDFKDLYTAIIDTPVPTHIDYDLMHTSGAFFKNSLKEFDYGAHHVLDQLPGGGFGYRLVSHIVDTILGGN